VEGGRGAGDPGHGGRPGCGAKRRGGRGQLIPLLTLARDGLWREIDGGGRSATRNGTGGAGGGDGELGEEGELVMEVRDEVGSRSGPFIGAGRSVRWRYLSSRSFDGRQWRWGENILALTHRRGFMGLGAVGCDASCRFAVEEGRQRRRAVVEVTSRSNGGLRLSGKRGALLPLLQARGRPWRAALEGSVGREVARRGGRRRPGTSAGGRGL
jgi:hypothetical protein